jgi:hypothetical protein
MLRYACFLGCLLACLGCSDGGKKVVRVTGKVTRNGQPVPNVALTFTPAKGRPSWGMADDQGNFKLQYSIDQDGAEVDTHAVTVEFPPVSVQEEDDFARGKKKISGDRKAILQKYGDATKPALTMEIKSSGPIEVKLD